MAITSKSLKRSLRENLLFALPFIAGQIGIMLFGVSDVFVAGHYSQEAVAALGLATGLSSGIFMLGIGIMNAIAPLAAYDKGRGEIRHIYFLPGLLVAILIGLLAWPATLLSLRALPWFDPNPALVPLVDEYLVWVAPSIVFVYLFSAAKEYLQARGHTIFVNAAIIFFNIVNLLLNVVLMFGLGSLQGMGVKGVALATFLTRTALAAVTLAYAWRVLKIKRNDWRTIELKNVWEIFRLGLPLGVSILTEVLVFCTVTLLIGSMETVYSAAHNLVLTLASLTFMVPLALSSVAAVKVSYAKGQGDFEAVAHHAASCLLLSFLFMFTTACFYFAVPGAIVSLATSDQQLIMHASVLLLYVGIFQIPDGVQVTLFGALRGLSVARLPLLITLIGHWAIGLPIGHYLAFEKNMKAQGLWIGLTIGLIAMAIGLGLVWPWALKKQKRLLQQI
jgi:MATE family multidrug resistance protein